MDDSSIRLMMAAHLQSACRCPLAPSSVVVLWDFVDFTSEHPTDIRAFYFALMNLLTSGDPALQKKNVSTFAVSSSFFQSSITELTQLGVSLMPVADQDDWKALEALAGDIRKHAGQTTTEVVIISSRLDVCRTVRELERQDIKVLLVHNTAPGSDAANIMSLYPTSIVHLSQLMVSRQQNRAAAVRQELGDHLYQYIKEKTPNESKARKVTGMILQLENCDIQRMLNGNGRELDSMISAALLVLEDHTAEKRLYHYIAAQYPGKAAQVTDMLLEMEKKQIHQLLKHHRINEAFGTLEAQFGIQLQRQ
jgi:hypothetical protein